MTIFNKAILPLVLIVSLSSVMLINGCGSTKDAKDSGCPSGSNFAASTDKIIVPTLKDDSRIVFSGSFVSLFGVPYVPEPTITVVDVNGAPRNKVCVVITTNGSWWTDNTYTTPLFGTGINNQVLASTDASGTVTLHWTTYPLPLSTASTSTADGANVDYPPALIGVSSGAVSALMSPKITVKGCPKELAGFCP